MSTEVATTSADKTVALLRKGVQHARQVLPEKGELNYMRFEKDGTWSFGIEHTEIEEDSKWAVNPMSIKLGFVCWSDEENVKRKKLGHVLAPFYSEPVRVEDLTQHSAPWREAASVQMKCLNGEDKDTEVVFETNSGGGQDFIRKLIDAIGTRLDDTGNDDIVPVVKLFYSTYIHKKHGKVYKPEASIQEWVAMDGQPVNAETVNEKITSAEPENESPFKEEEQAPTRTRTRRRRSK